MRKLALTLLTCLLLLIPNVELSAKCKIPDLGCAAGEVFEIIDIKDLVKRNGVHYEKSSDVPFTGIAIRNKDKWTFREGKKNGPYVVYWDNGQLKEKGNFKNGKKVGD